MKFITEILSDLLNDACIKAGFKEETLPVTLSKIENVDYQCSAAMGLTKTYHTAPVVIAEKIVENINDTNKILASISVAKPGYINIVVNDDFLSKYLLDYANDLDNHAKARTTKQKIIVDYGGANVAKPLHVGHLRSANIGESIKRICQYVGNDTLGDVHLGDWGLQMGMVISEIKRLHPDLPYFNDNFKGKYPKESPINIHDLETIYPNASKRAKESEKDKQEAKQITHLLQQGHPGYYALWKHIVNTSITDLKANYDRLNVHFDLWLGESDTVKYYNEVINFFVSRHIAYLSQGALIIDVKEPDDAKEIPPFILQKSDGSVLYSTTDLATLVQRDRELNTDKVIYVVDNRQELHFTQLFRVVKHYPILSRPMELVFAGFGTMNGKDGKPYKTRDGGVMKLQDLIEEVKKSASTKSNEETISDAVAISALKFADLSILRTKDYVFDPDKFCSFEGKTGPYLLYTLTRAKSILKKVGDVKGSFNAKYCDKSLLLNFLEYGQTILDAYKLLSPNILCDYVYNLSNLFNSFYAKTSIISEQNVDKKYSMLEQTKILVKIIDKILNLLAIQSLDKM